MPNILMLKDRKTGEYASGRGLIAVDEALCESLGVPVDDEKFYAGWVDWWSLYMTNDWDEVRRSYTDPKHEYDNSEGWVDTRVRVIDWLAERYELASYAEIGRR